MTISSLTARVGGMRRSWQVTAHADAHPAGQIELYTHIPLLPRLINHLSTSSLGFRCSAVYLLESQFMQADKAKFFAGVLSAMSCMLQMGCGMLCVMSKMDLVRKAASGGKKGRKGEAGQLGKEVSRLVAEGDLKQCEKADYAHLGTLTRTPCSSWKTSTRKQIPSSTPSIKPSLDS